MANAIKKKEETNVVKFDPSMFESDANEGLGQLQADDLAIPFLRILSDTSLALITGFSISLRIRFSTPPVFSKTIACMIFFFL